MDRTDFNSQGSSRSGGRMDSYGTARSRGVELNAPSIPVSSCSQRSARTSASAVHRAARGVITTALLCMICMLGPACATLTDVYLASYRNDELVRNYRYALGEQYIDIDGLKLCYQEHGVGEVLLILPGLGTSADFWQLTIPAMAEHYRVVAVDLPGFGKSDKPPDASYELLWMCDKILAFMDAKGIESANVMGGSMGGHLGLLLALNHPARITKLIMVGACGAWPEPGILLHAGFHTVWQECIVADHLRRNWPHIYRRLYVRQTPITERIFRYQMAVRAVASLFAGEGRASTRSLRSIFYTTCRHRLADVSQPVLLVWGEKDFIHPPKDGVYLRQHLLNCRLVIIRDAAHEVMVDQPDTFNRLVLEFLKHGVAAIKDDF